MDTQQPNSPFPPAFPQDPIPREVREARKLREMNAAAFLTAPSPSEPQPTPPITTVPPDFDDSEEEDAGGAIRRLALLVGGIFLSLVIVASGVLYFIRKDEQEKEGAQVVETQNLEGAISAVLGGVITNGPAQVIIPPGALEKDTVVTIEKTGPGDFVDEYILKPEGVKFLKPVTVVIPYNREPRNDTLIITYGDREERLQFQVEKMRKVLVMQVMEF